MRTHRELVLQVYERRMREQARRNGGVTPIRKTRAIIDRVEFTSAEWTHNKTQSIPGFILFKSHRVNQSVDSWQPYTWVMRFHSADNKTKISVLSKPWKPWLEPFRVAVIPDDATGLLPRHIFPFWKLCSGQRIRLLEWAVDFPRCTGITSARVLRTAIFGKSRAGEEKYALYDTWGTRKSGKFVHSYYKFPIESQRVELQLRQRFLDANKINQPSDFAKLADILPNAHIRFVQIDDLRIVQRLRRAGRAREVGVILRRLDELRPRLHSALTYLRGNGMLNVHRFLVPLTINRLVREAAAEFRKEWNWL